MYFEDECHFKQTLSITRAWYLKGSCPEIKSPVDRYKMSVFGAMGKNGQVIYQTSEIFNAQTFLEFLTTLLLKAEVGKKRDGTNKKLLLVLDNAKYHHAKLLKEFLISVSSRLELYFLPPYSPELNPIEILWKKTRRHVTHNRFFQDVENLKLDLTLYWNGFRSCNSELKSLSEFI